MKIAVLDDYHGYAERFADWGAHAGAVTTFRAPIPEAEIIATLAPFDVLCIMRERTPLPASVLSALPRLRLIITTGMRNAAIDMAAAAAAGILVCGTASRAAATSHLAMMLILVAARNVLPNVNALAAGGWQAPAGRDLEGLTLGLIGLGRLGAAVAALARPFGMKLVAWSHNLTEARCAEVGVTHAGSLAALLAQSDIASIHLVLSERTTALIGPDELALMKPDAALVNTSRGPIIAQSALLDALRLGRPGCAALDVFTHEPLPDDSPLRDAALIAKGKLILTPHIGYGSLQTFEIMYREMGESLRAFAAGTPVRVLTA